MRKRFLICVIVLLAVFAASAQRRIPCDRALRDTRLLSTRAAETRVYHTIPLEGSVRIPVVLVTFSDVGFSDTGEKVRASWDAKLNQTGYGINGAQGSAADYFRKQSGGRLELVFDVFGPVALPHERAYYGANAGDEDDLSKVSEMIMGACRASGNDFTAYDYDSNKRVDLTIVVFAGRGENNNGPADAVWPHKYAVMSDGKIGDMRIFDYICVAELNARNLEDGHGVICHEVSHSLGLPDLYPINSDLYSLFDEWDLMDGGDYANWGYSPPNYSAFERSLLGWGELLELTEPVSVSGMPVWDTDPVAYVVRNDANPEQYLVLENRRQQGWDSYLPGNGLLVTYVNNYDYSLAPNVDNVAKVSMIASDNKNYDDYYDLYGEEQKYTSDWHNRYFSMSAYPCVVDGKLFNEALTATSLPANPLNKAITNIRVADDGTISFDFMKESTGIQSPKHASDAVPVAWFDLQGHTLPGLPHHKGTYIVHYSDGTIKKCIR